MYAPVSGPGGKLNHLGAGGHVEGEGTRSSVHEDRARERQIAGLLVGVVLVRGPELEAEGRATCDAKPRLADQQRELDRAFPSRFHVLNISENC